MGGEPLKLGLDFDGVIANSAPLKALAAKKLFNITVSAEDCKRETILKKGIMTAKQYDSIQDLAYWDPELGMTMQPIPEALLYLEKLQEDGHKIIVITARTSGSIDIAQEWLSKQGVHLEFWGVGRGSKLHAAQKWGIEVFLDDDPKKLEPLSGVVQQLFLMSCGYNLEYETNDTITRVASWSEFYLQLAKI